MSSSAQLLTLRSNRLETARQCYASRPSVSAVVLKMLANVMHCTLQLSGDWWRVLCAAPWLLLLFNLARSGLISWKLKVMSNSLLDGRSMRIGDVGGKWFSGGLVAGCLVGWLSCLGCLTSLQLTKSILGTDLLRQDRVLPH